MDYELVSSSGSKWTVFGLEISKPNSLKSITLYVTADRADIEARRLSAMLPDREVTITTAARVKARYLNGERTQVNDYREFYFNLTEKEYRATLIQDFKTAEWI